VHHTGVASTLPASRASVRVHAEVRDVLCMQGGEGGESSGQPHAPSAATRVDGCARGGRRRAAHGHLPRQAHRIRDGPAVPRLGVARRVAHGLPRLASVSSGAYGHDRPPPSSAPLLRTRTGAAPGSPRGCESVLERVREREGTHTHTHTHARSALTWLERMAASTPTLLADSTAGVGSPGII